MAKLNLRCNAMLRKSHGSSRNRIPLSGAC